jgi:hypothetical protein
MTKKRRVYQLRIVGGHVNDPQTVNGNWYGCTTIDREAI